MVCPYCFSAKTQVYNSRATKKINEIWRRRRCVICMKEFTTYERAHPQTILQVMSDARVESFLQSKLLLSLLKACDHRHDDEVIFYLLETIQQALYRLAVKNSGTVSPDDIFLTAALVLERFDTVAYIKYLSIRGDAQKLSARIKDAAKKITF